MTRTNRKSARMHYLALAVLAAATFTLAFLSYSIRPQAQSGLVDTCIPPTCNCPPGFAGVTATQVSEEHNITRIHFGLVDPIPSGVGELGEHQRFLIDYLFLGRDNIGGILPAWMLMSRQLTSVAYAQMEIIGAFLDAKHQLESQRIFRHLAAKAHKQYQPSHGMCVMGTNTRSLANAEHRARLASFVIGQRALQRQLGSAWVNAADGPTQDMKGRMIQFISHFCDVRDNNFITGGGLLGTTRPDVGLQLICPMATQDARRPTLQTDIDYTRTVELPRSIDIDYDGASTVPTNDERAIFELSTNLFGHRVFNRINDEDLQFLANHDEYQDMRAVIAKRSVAQNSFNRIVGMKALGSYQSSLSAGAGVGSSNDTGQYMEHFLRELGVLNNDEMPHMLGDHAGATTQVERPSYMAQMEMVAKRIYQDPNFFTNLYDTPANVKRKSAALQAISLMLDRDMYDSQIRSEMLVSQLLELRLVRAQRKAQTDNKLMAPVEER